MLYMARLALHVWRMIFKSCAGCLILKCYVWFVPGGRQTQCFEITRNISKSGVRRNISKSSARCNFLIMKCCVWLASGGHQTQCFEITRQTQRFKIPNWLCFSQF